MNIQNIPALPGGFTPATGAVPDCDSGVLPAALNGLSQMDGIVSNEKDFQQKTNQVFIQISNKPFDKIAGLPEIYSSGKR